MHSISLCAGCLAILHIELHRVDSWAIVVVLFPQMRYIPNLSVAVANRYYQKLWTYAEVLVLLSNFRSIADGGNDEILTEGTKLQKLFFQIIFLMVRLFLKLNIIALGRS